MQRRALVIMAKNIPQKAIPCAAKLLVAFKGGSRSVEVISCSEIWHSQPIPYPTAGAKMQTQTAPPKYKLSQNFVTVQEIFRLRDRNRHA
jgi:hypothetical protein